MSNHIGQHVSVNVKLFEKCSVRSMSLLILLPFKIIFFKYAFKNTIEYLFENQQICTILKKS